MAPARPDNVPQNAAKRTSTKPHYLLGFDACLPNSNYHSGEITLSAFKSPYSGRDGQNFDDLPLIIMHVCVFAICSSALELLVYCFGSARTPPESCNLQHKPWFGNAHGQPARTSIALLVYQRY